MMDWLARGILCLDDQENFAKKTFLSKRAPKETKLRHSSNWNPHWTQQYRNQYWEKVNFWAAIVDERILSLSLFEEIFTGTRYLQFLQSDIVSLIKNEFQNDSMWFQKDGAPPHYANNVKQYLHVTFPEKWIGRGGPVEWPARLLNLILLISFYGDIWKAHFSQKISLTSYHNFPYFCNTLCIQKYIYI